MARRFEDFGRGSDDRMWFWEAMPTARVGCLELSLGGAALADPSQEQAASKAQARGIDESRCRGGVGQGWKVQNRAGNGGSRCAERWRRAVEGGR